MFRIKKETMESIILASNNTYPNEFFSLLGGDRKRGIIDELVVVPATYGRNFTAIKSWLIPIDSRVMGSVHSHPSPSPYPSMADLRSFTKFGDFHIIAAYPFDLESIAAFDSRGKQQEFIVV